MSLRRRDVEQWMSHRRLPEELRRYKNQLIILLFDLSCGIISSILDKVNYFLLESSVPFCFVLCF